MRAQGLKLTAKMMPLAPPASCTACAEHQYAFVLWKDARPWQLLCTKCAEPYQALRELAQ